MDKLLGPTKKLIFAEYLINHDDPEMFTIAARKHILEASKEVLMFFTNLDSMSVDSPQIISNVLRKFEDATPMNFFKFYKNLSNLEPPISTEQVTNALNKVKEFISWVETYKRC